MRFEDLQIEQRLAAVPARGLTLFAAASAERLIPLYELFTERGGRGDPAVLRAAVDVAWAADDSEGDAAVWQERAEALVPDEEDETWTDESAYAQNATAAAAYALRTRIAGSVQEASWAALQAYEAADQLAQRRLAHLDLNAPGTEAALLEHPVVQDVLHALRTDLDTVTSGNPSAESLRDSARQDGERLARYAAS